MKSNRKEHALEDLKQQILTTELAPGLPLDEASMSKQYGLSRTPLREVLQRLAGEGYISLETNRGASVSSMDFNTMRNFFQTAPMIYAAIARLAAEHATPAQIAVLQKTQQTFRDAVNQDRVSDMALYNHRFHEQLGEMAASLYLLPSLGRLLIDHTRMSHRFYRTQDPASRTRIQLSSEHHDAMIEAIEQRSPDTIVELTWQHWELSRSEIDKYVRPDPLPLDSTEQLTGVR